MKYKTARQNHIVISFFFMLFCICLGIPILKYRTVGDISYYIVAMSIFLTGILFFIHSVTYDRKRNIYKKNGISIPGNIISAERMLGTEKTKKYFLKIQFYDEGNKIRYTEAYVGNPNTILKNCNCNIYKWKGKYIEADFNILDKENKTTEEIIPIKIIFGYPFGKVDKVKEV